MYRYVEQFVPREATAWERDAHYVVAAMFGAYHAAGPAPPGATGRGDLGAGLARLKQITGSESTEGRFTALLNAHIDELPEHLRHAVSLLRSKDVGVDWARLLRDIRAWNAPTRWVQREWARSFWGGWEGSESGRGGEPVADEPGDEE